MRIVVELTEREADELVRADWKPRRDGGESIQTFAVITREMESAQRKVVEAIDAARFLSRAGR
jgi:2-phospho-L-lactate transferase/gluconeogenesis factor (CofD/UPF0052 family)